MNKTPFIVGVLILAVIVGGYFWQNKAVDAPIVACTMEAKLCPDGSSVGRSGPQCEFAECPTMSETPSPTAGWKVQNNTAGGFAFQYPEKTDSEFISVNTSAGWPPVVTVTSATAGCATGTSQQTIGGKNYCVKTESEGAAGSTYNTYTYSTVRSPENKTITAKFTLRFVQCANYPEPQKTACDNDRVAFSVDALADRIMNTVQLTSSPVALPGTSQRMTLTGTQVCLPHTNTDGPQTMECAMGLKTDAGLYYGMDFSLVSQSMPTINNTDRIRVTGLVTPAEALSSEFWQRYPIKGIMSVTDTVTKL